MKTLFLVTSLFLVIFQTSAQEEYGTKINLLGQNDHSGTTITLTGYGSNDSFHESRTTTTNGTTSFSTVSLGVPYKLTASHQGYETVVVDSVVPYTFCESATVACYDRYLMTRPEGFPDYLQPDTAICLSGIISNDLERGLYIVCDTTRISTDIKIHSGSIFYFKKSAFLLVGAGVTVNVQGTENDSIRFTKAGDFYQDKHFAFRLQEQSSLYLNYCNFKKQLAVTTYQDATNSSVSAENCSFIYLGSKSFLSLNNADLFFKNNYIESSTCFNAKTFNQIIIEGNNFNKSNIGYLNGSYASGVLKNSKGGEIIFRNNLFTNSKLGTIDSTDVIFTENILNDSPILNLNKCGLTFSCNKVYSSLIYTLENCSYETFSVKDNYFELSGNSEIRRENASYGWISNNYFLLNGYTLKINPSVLYPAPVLTNQSLRIVRNTFRAGYISIQESGASNSAIQFFGNILNSVIVSEETVPEFNKNLITSYVACLQCPEPLAVPDAEIHMDESQNIYINDPGFQDESSPVLNVESAGWFTLSPSDFEEYHVFVTAPDYMEEEQTTETYKHLGYKHANTCLESYFPPMPDGGTGPGIFADTLSISGNVEFMHAGIVAAIKIPTGEATVTTPDSQGNYKLDSLFPGSYLIYAIPDPESQEDHLPTVYYNNYTLDKGNSIELEGHSTQVDFSLLNKNTVSGLGTNVIKGRVTYLQENNTDDQTAWSHNWFNSVNSGIDYLPDTKNPGQYVPLLIKNSSGTIVRWALTDNNGYFETGNLPDGTYYMQAVRYGYSLNFTGPFELATKTKIVETQLVEGFTTSIQDPAALAKIRLYPNPFTEHIQVENVSAGAHVVVTQADGIEVMSSVATDTFFSIPTGQWNKGVYLIQVDGHVFKMVK